MQSDLWQRRIGWICLAAIILFSGALAQSKHAAADDADPNAPPDDVSNLIAQAPNDTVRPALDWLRYAGSQFGDTGKYWLGVECREVQPELRDQLSLKDDEGLVVVHVAEDGPASKAGIKQHDVIISAGDEKLSHPADLVKAVNAADGKELSLKIIRGGKEQTIAVTPAERQQGSAHIIARPGPGFMFPGGGPHVDLPDNVTVTVVHHGKEPGKITVTRGDEKWDLTDQELNKLPDDLRPLVERTIGGGPWAMQFPGGFNMPGMRIEGMPMGPPGANPPPRDGNGPPPLGDINGPPGDVNGPPPRDGNGPPRRDGNRPPDNGGPPPRDGNPPPRDGNPNGPNGPRPPQAGPDGRGGQRPQIMPPGQLAPELMQRLDEIQRRLDLIQQDIQRLRDGGGPMPRMRPRDGDNAMPRMMPRGPDDGRNGPPGGPPPNDGNPPPRDGNRQDPPPDGPGRQPPPNDQ
ncbi:MAG TPA: PDZ domain-containing protein [Pirellulales bacterium]|nr:PDZ domain-containing protein [Pirellulales bacterium]